MTSLDHVLPPHEQCKGPNQVTQTAPDAYHGWIQFMEAAPALVLYCVSILVTFVPTPGVCYYSQNYSRFFRE